MDRIEEGRRKDYRPKKDYSREGKPSRVATVLHGTTEAHPADTSCGQTSEVKPRVYCPYCCNNQHFLDQCANFKQLSRDQRITWVKSNNRCWRCGRQHLAAQCKLKLQCKICRGKHLESLHVVNDRTAAERKDANPTSSKGPDQPTDILYLDRRAGCNQVLLKISKVLLRSGDHSLETYAILDDGSERTILLPEATRHLKLDGQPESLTVRTIRHDERTLQGSSVTFTISPVNHPAKTFTVDKAFTAAQLGLADHTYPVDGLKRKFKHLKSLPLEPFYNAKPLLLIGSDHPHLITPIKPVRLGPPGGPAAVKTRLGWTLQGPVSRIQCNNSQQCLFLSTCSPMSELYSQVEKLWQLDTLPYQNEKLVTQSRRDQEAIELLEAKTQRVEVDGVRRYATPLLRVASMPILRAPPQAVLPHLRAIEKRLMRDQVKAQAYSTEIRKLEESGYIRKISPELEATSTQSWFIPHHLVTHNGKNRVVFNCSFDYENQNINKLLLPGPNLGPSILGVLLRFREHSTAISSDIKGMFHQVRLLPEDRPFTRFLWRDLKRDSQPDVYEWQVLPFGTTCSPCCAIYALLRHVRDHSYEGEDVRCSVEAHFYVDNWLQSFPSAAQAKRMVDKTRALLTQGGLELRQWASNQLEVINHLPRALRSESSEQWLNHGEVEQQEHALGLSWMCQTDTIRYRSRPLRSSPTTMRSIYRVLASQYDPLGFLIPYTTRAKIIVQQLWDKERGWDDPLLPKNLLNAWQAWEGELCHIDSICLPRCYVSPEMDHADTWRMVHIFCDASERAYGSVAYLRTEDTQGRVEVAFLTARSRVAPKRQLSMPRLELCAALTGAQLAKLLQRELTEAVHRVTMWTDSTTVLSWIRSDSCHFKVFVGTRIAEIQELTDLQAWRYVPSAENPADDLTRGKTLQEIAGKSRWACSPSFLALPPEQWPVEVPFPTTDHSDELRKAVICLLTMPTASINLPDTHQYSTFSDLVAETARRLHGAAPEAEGNPMAEHYRQAELNVLRAVQLESFPDEVWCLKEGRSLPMSSRLLTLAPELDHSLQLIRVGGRLRRCDKLEADTVHPVLLDPKHPITKLLIQQTDRELKHPGAERLFAELRRKYWILRGREAVRKEQRCCFECQKWRAQPIVPTVRCQTCLLLVSDCTSQHFIPQELTALVHCR
ncbi:uncharacterized protein [Paramormyrops kingsleyae]|uniref:uncharacterized protein n=1 Tax=Paramormyrops kingsleyae TaxID=1676925 RepID=UPI003B973A26